MLASGALGRSSRSDSCIRSALRGVAPNRLSQSHASSHDSTRSVPPLPAATGQPEPRHRLTPAWLLSQAGGSAGPAKATDAKCRLCARLQFEGQNTRAIAPGWLPGPASDLTAPTSRPGDIGKCVRGLRQPKGAPTDRDHHVARQQAQMVPQPRSQASYVGCDGAGRTRGPRRLGFGRGEQRRLPDTMGSDVGRATPHSVGRPERQRGGSRQHREENGWTPPVRSARRGRRCRSGAQTRRPAQRLTRSRATSSTSRIPVLHARCDPSGGGALPAWLRQLRTNGGADTRAGGVRRSPCRASESWPSGSPWWKNSRS